MLGWDRPNGGQSEKHPCVRSFNCLFEVVILFACPITGGLPVRLNPSAGSVCSLTHFLATFLFQSFLFAFSTNPFHLCLLLVYFCSVPPFCCPAVSLFLIPFDRKLISLHAIKSVQLLSGSLFTPYYFVTGLFFYKNKRYSSTAQLHDGYICQKVQHFLCDPRGASFLNSSCLSRFIFI